MTPLRALAIVAAVAGCALAGARPALADDWAVAPSQPLAAAAVQAVEPGNSEAQPFLFRGAPLAGPAEPFITVWNRNPGAPGNLFPDDTKVDFFPAAPSPVDPTTYRGLALGTWRWTPGVYYWRVDAGVMQTTPITRFFTASSPIFTFTVKRSASHSTPYATCAALGARLKSFTRRIRSAQRALGRARSGGARRHLRSTLRRLKHQRSDVQTRLSRHC
jgi:hypothetical protein